MTNTSDCESAVQMIAKQRAGLTKESLISGQWVGWLSEMMGGGVEQVAVLSPARAV
jgi:hypothetical protein